MSADKLDWVNILNDLEAKKAALEATIASVRSAMAIGALGQIGDMPPALLLQRPAEQPVELPTGALLGKSIPAAIKLYLNAMKKKQTIREITTALQDGGVESTSTNFDSIITGALNRLKSSGEVLRFKDGWGLAELYPESLRARISLVGKPKTKNKRKAKAKTERRTKPEVAEGVKSVGPQKIIERYIDENKGKRVTAVDVAKILGMRTQTVALVLSKLAYAGTNLGKNADGTFSIGEIADAQLVN